MGLLDAVGNAVSAATDAVGDVVGDIGEAVGDVGGGVVDVVSDSFEAVGIDLGPVDDVLKGAMEGLADGGLGGALDGALDELGMPDWIGDVAGGVLDFCTGNYVGAAAQGLDALGDVAKACGGPEIAGFLEAGSEVTGMFAGGTGVDVGSVGDLLGSAGDSVEMIDEALGGVEAFAKGDLVGAGDQLLDMVGGDLGPLGGVVDDLSSDTLSVLDDVVPQAGQILDGVGGALEDGQLDVGDLQQLPLGQIMPGLADATGIDELESLAEPVVDFLERGHQAAGTGQTSAFPAAAQSLIDGVIGEVGSRLPDDAADIGKLEDKADVIGGLLEMITEDADAARLVRDLLANTDSMTEDLDHHVYHGASMRA